ncbi:MAG: FitA-like ribbon-helix-helix domain-containing protein [Candidatus Binatus sp.]
MAQLVVRNLPEGVKESLRRRANRHGQSMEAEARDILRNAVKADAHASVPLGTRIHNRFALIGLEQDIPELRGQKAKPARFGR